MSQKICEMHYSLDRFRPKEEKSLFSLLRKPKMQPLNRNCTEGFTIAILATNPPMYPLFMKIIAIAVLQIQNLIQLRKKTVSKFKQL
jgi:hypothetical protein